MPAQTPVCKDSLLAMVNAMNKQGTLLQQLFIKVESKFAKQQHEKEREEEERKRKVKLERERERQAELARFHSA